MVSHLCQDLTRYNSHMKCQAILKSCFDHTYIVQVLVPRSGCIKYFRYAASNNDHIFLAAFLEVNNVAQQIGCEDNPAFLNTFVKDLGCLIQLSSSRDVSSSIQNAFVSVEICFWFINHTYWMSVKFRIEIISRHQSPTDAQRFLMRLNMPSTSRNCFNFAC